jgi:hypothetical protein
MPKLPFIAVILAIVAIALGVGLGFQTANAELKDKVQFAAEYLEKNGIAVDPEHVEERLPKVEIVGEAEQDFGHIGYEDTIRREFQIKNSGKGELRVDAGEVSCGQCTWIEIPHENLPEGVRNAPEDKEGALLIAPGATATVFVHFTQKKKEYTPQVSEWANFRTSDPRNRIVEFRIKGRITKAYRLTSDRFHLAQITIGNGVESRLGVFGYGAEPLQIDKVEFLTEVKDSEFTAKIEPMPDEEVKAEAGATSGFDVVLTGYAPPLGKISHMLRLHVANAEPKTVDIPVGGNVVGNIQLIKIGDNPRVNWLQAENYLDWSVVDGKTGDEIMLRIRAKTKPTDPPIEFKIKSVYPSDSLEAELGESTRLDNAQAVPLKIRIPPGSKPANYRSLSVDSKPARIVIETNDPVTREIVVGVRFGIE